MAYIIACAVRVPLPRFAVGVGHCLYNGLRGARVCLGLRSGWGIAYIMACAVHVPLPRFELGVGHGLYNGLRCAHAAASV